MLPRHKPGLALKPMGHLTFSKPTPNHPNSISRAEGPVVSNRGGNRIFGLQKNPLPINYTISEDISDKGRVHNQRLLALKGRSTVNVKDDGREVIHGLSSNIGNLDKDSNTPLTSSDVQKRQQKRQQKRRNAVRKHHEADNGKEYTHSLPCPIRAGNPERYNTVTKHCTQGQRFSSCARLKYVALSFPVGPFL